jgi:hypothetical protein
MSDSNRIKVAFKKEVTAGTPPAGPYQQINVSSCSLSAQKATAEENTIRDDRNLKGLIMTSMVPQGGIGFDQIYGNFDPLLFGLLGQAAASTPVSIASTPGTFATNVFTATTGTPFSVCVAGQWVGFKIGTANYVAQITAIGGSGASITLAGATFADGAATLLNVRGSYVRNGTTMSTFTLEQNFSDESTKGFFAYTGCVPNTYSLNAQAEQVVTGDMQFMGMAASAPATSSVSAAAYTAPVTNDAFAGLTGNIGQFMINGTLITATDAAIRGINLSFNNNVRRDAAINVARMGWGQATITGQMDTFFKGGLAAVDAFFSHSSSSCSYSMTDPAGNVMVISVLNLKFSNFTSQIGGKNQAVMGTLDFTGILNPTRGATIQLDFIPAAP